MCKNLKRNARKGFRVNEYKSVHQKRNLVCTFPIPEIFGIFLLKVRLKICHFKNDTDVVYNEMFQD